MYSLMLIRLKLTYLVSYVLFVSKDDVIIVAIALAVIIITMNVVLHSMDIN